MVTEVKPSEEGFKVVPSMFWMKSKESISDILACKVEQWELATWMVLEPVGNVVHFAMNGDP